MDFRVLLACTEINCTLTSFQTISAITLSIADIMSLGVVLETFKNALKTSLESSNAKSDIFQQSNPIIHNNYFKAILSFSALT